MPSVLAVAQADFASGVHIAYSRAWIEPGYQDHRVAPGRRAERDEAGLRYDRCDEPRCDEDRARTVEPPRERNELMLPLPLDCKRGIAAPLEEGLALAPQTQPAIGHVELAAAILRRLHQLSQSRRSRLRRMPVQLAHLGQQPAPQRVVHRAAIVRI